MPRAHFEFNSISILFGVAIALFGAFCLAFYGGLTNPLHTSNTFRFIGDILLTIGLACAFIGHRRFMHNPRSWGDMQVIFGFIGAFIGLIGIYASFMNPVDLPVFVQISIMMAFVLAMALIGPSVSWRKVFHALTGSGVPLRRPFLTS